MNALLLEGGEVYRCRGGQWGLVRESLLVRGGKIETLGEVIQAPRFTERIDLTGKLVLPGLCDAHIHLAAGGRTLALIDLGYLDQVQVETSLAAAVAKLPLASWLEAFNWDESRAHLNTDILDRISGNRPAVVYKRDLHACCCNSAALRAIGVTQEYIAPSDGEVGRYADGRLNGMLYEAVTTLIHKAVPTSSALIKRHDILVAQDYLIKLGVTAVSEVLDEGNALIYSELEQSGELKIDVDGWMRIEQWDGSAPSLRGEKFRVQTLKVFLDGALGSRTAALIDPFTDAVDQSGMLFFDDEALRDLLAPAAEAGWRLAIHALGDRALAQVCRVLPLLPKRAVLHRIEHLQLLPSDGIKLVVGSGATASIQPVHLLDDQDWLLGRIGAERCRRSFIWRGLLERGVLLAAGSDWPVATPDPLHNLHSAINRARFGESPKPIFSLAEALTPVEAIATLTTGWAEACGRESERGLIAVGMDANFTIIDGFDPALHDWSGAKVSHTIVRGEVAHTAD